MLGAHSLRDWHFVLRDKSKKFAQIELVKTRLKMYRDRSARKQKYNKHIDVWPRETSLVWGARNKQTCKNRVTMNGINFARERRNGWSNRSHAHDCLDQFINPIFFSHLSFVCRVLGCRATAFDIWRAIIERENKRWSARYNRNCNIFYIWIFLEKMSQIDGYSCRCVVVVDGMKMCFLQFKFAQKEVMGGNRSFASFGFC